MRIQQTFPTDTTTLLVIEAEPAELEATKQLVLQKLKKDVKLPGFRAGKVPAELIERNIDPAAMQNEFLDTILNQLYGAALQQKEVRPVAQPQVSVKKFVPYTTLEFEAEVEIIGKISLPDYTKISLAKKSTSVTTEDVAKVIDNLRLRTAEKAEVDRAAKDKDEVWINFKGRDAKTGEAISGADGEQYPLALGSNTFIPGFEDNLVGVKPGEEKEFTLDFPKDYGVAALQNRKVTFVVTVTKVTEVKMPQVDDAFAATAGPFKTVAELKADIKKQLQSERDYQDEREYESDLIGKITEKAQLSVPASLVDDELDRLEREERQNVVYRGQTWEEHLASAGVTETEHRAKHREGAEMRVKAGLVLAEIANTEKVEVTPEEVKIRIQMLKAQYQDPAMQAELDKPENLREVASRLLSEKTIALLVGYANKASKAKTS